MTNNQKLCLSALDETGDIWTSTRGVAVKAFGLDFPEPTLGKRQTNEEKRIMIMCRRTLLELETMGFIEKFPGNNHFIWRRKTNNGNS